MDSIWKEKKDYQKGEISDIKKKMKLDIQRRKFEFDTSFTPGLEKDMEFIFVLSTDSLDEDNEYYFVFNEGDILIFQYNPENETLDCLPPSPALEVLYEPFYIWYWKSEEHRILLRNIYVYYGIFGKPYYYHKLESYRVNTFCKLGSEENNPVCEIIH